MIFKKFYVTNQPYSERIKLSSNKIEENTEIYFTDEKGNEKILELIKKQGEENRTIYKQDLPSPLLKQIK